MVDPKDEKVERDLDLEETEGWDDESLELAYRNMIEREKNSIF